MLNSSENQIENSRVCDLDSTGDDYLKNQRKTESRTEHFTKMVS